MLELIASVLDYLWLAPIALALFITIQYPRKLSDYIGERRRIAAEIAAADHSLETKINQRRSKP